MIPYILRSGTGTGEIRWFNEHPVRGDWQEYDDFERWHLVEMGLGPIQLALDVGYFIHTSGDRGAPRYNTWKWFLYGRKQYDEDSIGGRMYYRALFLKEICHKLGREWLPKTPQDEYPLLVVAPPETLTDDCFKLAMEFHRFGGACADMLAGFWRDRLALGGFLIGAVSFFGLGFSIGSSLS